MGTSEPKTVNKATMEAPDRDQMSRRSLLIAGAAALGSTAISYSRVAGANDRISLAQVGIGNRGRELASVAADLKDRHNVEMTAICDLWKVNRERAAKTASAGGIADVIYRCKSHDRAACTTLCSAGSEKACGALGRMRR